MNKNNDSIKLTGAFEVKVPIKSKPDDVKNESKTKNSDSLKISKISKKPSPIRMPNTSENTPEQSGEDQNKGIIIIQIEDENKDFMLIVQHHTTEHNVSQ